MRAELLNLVEIQERIRVARIIAEDAEADAATIDGQPFDGRTVARLFGQQLAMIQRLALMVAELYEDEAIELGLLMDQAPPEIPPEVIHRP